MLSLKDFFASQVSRSSRPAWVSPGDLNAFFGLAVDNLSNLVILAGLLITVFQFPSDLVLYRMIPGTAIGVLIGDLAYTWMAIRLARAEGRSDVTAMPLGLDTPSLFGMVFAVIGPVATFTKDPMIAWKVGMAVTILMGLFKVGTAFLGEWVRRSVPRAGLLGSIAGVALILIAFLPTLKVFMDPLVGLTALGLLFVSLIGGVELPGRFPAAFAALLAGTLVFYLEGWIGWGQGGGTALAFGTPRLAFPWPTWGFLDGLPLGLHYLPVAIPFALATVIGGIDVTESAAAAGDRYQTRSILLIEGVATLVAGICGGVLQSTPYIGHPAYKAMGGRAAYTLATALVIGIGGMLGALSWVVYLIPEAAVAPILIFIGLEITAQAFLATPRRHARAVAFAFVPIIANLLLLHSAGLLAQVGHPTLSPEATRSLEAVRILGNGFILSALLWGAGLAFIIDRRLWAAASIFALAGVASLFGVIHSPLESGGLFFPWEVETNIPRLLGAGYGILAGILAGLAGRAQVRGEDE